MSNENEVVEVFSSSNKPKVGDEIQIHSRYLGRAIGVAFFGKIIKVSDNSPTKYCVEITTTPWMNNYEFDYVEGSKTRVKLNPTYLGHDLGITLLGEIIDEEKNRLDGYSYTSYKIRITTKIWLNGYEFRLI